MRTNHEEISLIKNSSLNKLNTLSIELSNVVVVVVLWTGDLKWFCFTLVPNCKN